jgi:hypothetical protein
MVIKVREFPGFPNRNVLDGTLKEDHAEGMGTLFIWFASPLCC